MVKGVKVPSSDPIEEDTSPEEKEEVAVTVRSCNPQITNKQFRMNALTVALHFGDDGAAGVVQTPAAEVHVRGQLVLIKYGKQCKHTE
jgi:hypothetical protein